MDDLAERKESKNGCSRKERNEKWMTQPKEKPKNGRTSQKGKPKGKKQKMDDLVETKEWMC